MELKPLLGQLARYWRPQPESEEPGPELEREHGPESEPEPEPGPELEPEHGLEREFEGEPVPELEPEHELELEFELEHDFEAQLEAETEPVPVLLPKLFDGHLA